jgi:hypothetical protein
MNINQQSEIESLFAFIKEKTNKPQSKKLTDEDLNKVRAFIVQSQRPLQAVRLLQKEREEREIDNRFTQQKDDIIQKARELDEEKNEFLEKQRRMISQIKEDYQAFVRNNEKRKRQEDDLKTAQETNKKILDEIATENEEIRKAKANYQARKTQLENLEKYHEFLINVCRNKEISSDEQSGENEIKNLRDRFVNLKTESKKLKKRK